MNLHIEYVSVNEKKYKLQHPGNRVVMRLQAESVNVRTGVTNLEAMMDYCFEYVVIPEGHTFRPTVDNVHPKEFEQWVAILPRFLRGDDLGEWKAAQEGAEESKKEGSKPVDILEARSA